MLYTSVCLLYVLSPYLYHMLIAVLNIFEDLPIIRNTYDTTYIDVGLNLESSHNRTASSEVAIPVIRIHYTCTGPSSSKGSLIETFVVLVFFK